MTTDFDAIIIGAGVIGLAIARQLSMHGHSVLVLEKASRAGTETSSRNSEVIHAGIYYPSSSLKARLCVEGRDLLYDFCASHGVAYKKLGKLIVATTAEEETKLVSIATLAKANGVHDLAWLSKIRRGQSGARSQLHTRSVFSFHRHCRRFRLYARPARRC